MSDLHLEFTDYAPAVVANAGEDLVVLAGDIGAGTEGIQWAKRAFPESPVLYVLGNHEFYGFDFQQLIEEAYAACAGSNVHMLENDSFRFRGIRFLGMSLWTNFLLAGPEGQLQAMQACERRINDFRHIRSGGRELLARETAERHAQSAAWLQGELQETDETSVVITHHAPCLPARHPRFAIDDITNTFVSDLPEEFFRTPVAWIFGHTHHSMEAIPHGGARLYSNQRGYPREGCDFDWCKILEVTPAGSRDA
jgi:hypothetical protein